MLEEMSGGGDPIPQFFEINSRAALRQNRGIREKFNPGTKIQKQFGAVEMAPREGEGSGIRTNGDVIFDQTHP